MLEGDHYVLNGSKIFITNGGKADIYIVFAMTDKSKGVKGISAFIVEKDFPGFSIGKKELKMGIRGSSTCELIFENCIVPKENLLGQEGKGFTIAMTTLDGGRVGIAAQALGIAQGAFDETVKYVKERKQFGRPISAFQNTQFQLADLKTKIEAARLLVYSAAVAKDTKKRFSTDAAMAKLFLCGSGDGSHHKMRAALWRIWLHKGLPRRAHDARREDYGNLRGYQRGSAYGYFRRVSEVEGSCKS